MAHPTSFLSPPSSPLHAILALCFTLLFIYSFILSHSPVPTPSPSILRGTTDPQQTVPDVLGLTAGKPSDRSGHDASFDSTGRQAIYQKAHNPLQASKQLEKVWRLDKEVTTNTVYTLQIGEGSGSDVHLKTSSRSSGSLSRPILSLENVIDEATSPFESPSKSTMKRQDNPIDASLLSNNTVYLTTSPERCDITLGRLNATELLERLRGKRLVFVGDSLNRNQWESMICILRAAVVDKSRISDNYLEHAKQGSVNFLDYNCRVEYYGSPFLVAESNRPGDRAGRFNHTLRLDKVDESEARWRNAHILVFNTGHWWTRGKTAKGRDFFQEGEVVYQKLNLRVALKKAMSTWGTWVDQYAGPTTSQVFFRAYSPSHFKGGDWDSGGQCDEEREPIFNDSFVASYPERMRVVEEVVQNMNTPVTILNVTRLTGYRKDAHPSIYGQARSASGRKAGTEYQDCSHWCLPGLPDIWNELLYYHLVMR